MTPARSKQIDRSMTVAILLALLFVLAGEAKAERLPLKVYTTSDGLARDHINRITQDSRGFLWFCTTEGLSRFDGYKFTNYGREQGLRSRYITDFLETRDGVYWIATSEGLYRFNPDPLQTSDSATDSSQRFILYHPGNSIQGRQIRTLYEDRSGTIWCGTWGGLYRLDHVDGQWVFSFLDIVKYKENVADSQLVQSILEDRSGALWINTKAGLYRRKVNGVIEAFAEMEGLPVAKITEGMIEDSNGQIWVGTKVGLYKLVADPQPNRSIVERVYATKEGLPKSEVTTLFQSSDGKLWIGAINGLSQFLPDAAGGGRFQDYTAVNGLSDVMISALAEDRYGNLWIGTDSGGAMKLAANGLTTYSATDGLGGTRIGSIFEDRAGNLCVISGNNFISHVDGRKFTAYPIKLPGGISYSGWGWYQTMLQDRAGEWWMSTGEGLVRYPKISIEQLPHARPKAIYTAKDGLGTSEVFRIFEDLRGDIWISTLGRAEAVLTRWERATETFHIYSPADNIPLTAPTAFCEDRSGNLWIGFYTGELLRYAAGRFTLFTQADGVPAGLIRGLYLDHRGRLWIATADGGVARLDDPAADSLRFVVYTTAEGLSSNQATCITEDRWGKIYIGTGRGLNRLDPTTGHIKQYTTADGLANTFINVSLRDSKGVLWFGTLQGLSRLDPQPEQPRPPPPIFISGLQIAGVSHPLSALGATETFVPELQADQNQIQIDFVGLSLSAGESLRYQYKLEGAAQDWSKPTDQRTVNYPNLSSGSYRFLVRAVSDDGTFSETPASVSFRILPPIWKRWWFITLALLVVASGIFAFDRYRVARLKELDAALTESRKLAEQLTEQQAELRKANRTLALEARITDTISESSTLNEAIPRILQAICEMAGWDAGALWDIDPQSGSLRHVDLWYKEADDVAQLQTQIQDRN